MRIGKRGSNYQFVLNDPIIIYSLMNCRIAPHRGFTLADYFRLLDTGPFF
jgi:hypothetical protein